MFEFDLLIHELRALLARACLEGLPFVGKGVGVCDELDAVVTASIQHELERLSESAKVAFSIGKSEGERDGVTPAILKDVHGSDPHLWVYVDPVDGTTTGANGGTRCYSAMAVDASPPSELLKCLPDSTSIFFVGSNLDAFPADITRGSDGLRELMHAVPDVKVGMLHREDNRLLFEHLKGRPVVWRHGTQTGYLPSVETDDGLLVGDSTVTLPYEVPVGFGRVGMVEAVIESTLWTSWNALVVSKQRILEHDETSAGYLDDYLATLSSGCFEMAQFFTEDEAQQLRSQGVDEEMLTALNPASLGRTYESVVVVASITGNLTPGIGVPRNVIDPIVSRGGAYEIAVLEKVRRRSMRCLKERISK